MKPTHTTSSKSSSDRQTSSWRNIWDVLNAKVITFTQPKRLPRKIQPYVLGTLGELLEEGFHLGQALEFMQLLLQPYTHLFQDMIESLNRGEPIEHSLQSLGFSIQIVAQLFYAQRQGRFIEALKQSGQQLAKENKHREQFIKQLAYPILLTFFLGALLFGMRKFMLPQISSFITQETYDNQWLVRALIGFFTYLPHLVIVSLTVVVFSVIGFDWYYRRLSYLARYQLLTRLPVVRTWVRYYASYHFTQQLGYFYGGGFAMMQILELWLAYPIDPLLTDIAQVLNQGFNRGESLTDLLSKLAIFTPELPLIIYQGELTSQVATKCHHYANKIYDDLMNNISKKIQWVQPILFILIAVLVMAMYLLMMLPMLTMEIN